MVSVADPPEATSTKRTTWSVPYASPPTETSVSVTA
jgi:hypothetical protein